ncbi:arsenate reductase family protein [Crocinitomix algicola]|uniref:arsenate reductase family protein n=1 Tax=Crocinitomix algicola TaxID=1740263 RepID=UPI0008733E5A|nr:ArsC/Spx/MgsR family protein [Crocinitomix algicola]
MKKVYYLSTCSTCSRILKEWDLDESYTLQDIKKDLITADQVDQMIKMAGSASAIFSKRSMKYRAMGLHEKELSENEMRNLILEEYTFLKRPVLIIDDAIFVGNSKKTVAAAKAEIDAKR